MPSAPDELAKRYLRREWTHLNAEERHVISAVIDRVTVSRDATALSDETRTVGERMADRIAEFGGSWRFILLFLAFLVVWVVLNTAILGPRREAFDPYPYIFLNLFLSMIAALQAPVIMMSQNRQGARDRIDAQNDYRVNLHAEVQIHELHEKLDQLRTERWTELIEMQQEQIRLLMSLAEQRGRES